MGVVALLSTVCRFAVNRVTRRTDCCDAINDLLRFNVYVNNRGSVDYGNLRIPLLTPDVEPVGRGS